MESNLRSKVIGAIILFMVIPVAFCADDGGTAVWEKEVQNGKIYSVSILEDGSLAAVSLSPTSKTTFEIHIFNRNGTLKNIFDEPEAENLDISSTFIAYGSAWDLGIRPTDGGPENKQNLVGSKGVSDVFISQGGETITAHNGAKQYMLDSSGNILWEKAFSNDIQQSALSPMGRIVYVVLSNRKLESLDDDGSTRWSRDLDFDVADVHANENGVVLGNGKSVSMFDMEGTKLWSTELDYIVKGVAVASNKNFVAVFTDGGRIYLLNGIGRVVKQLDFTNEIVDIDISREGKYLLLGQSNGKFSYQNIESYLDSTPPKIIISKPGKDTVVEGTILIDINIDDPEASIEILLDSKKIGTSFPIEFDTTILNDGLHTITVKGKDAMENVGTSSINFTVSNDAPIIDFEPSVPTRPVNPPKPTVIPFVNITSPQAGKVSGIVIIDAQAPPFADIIITINGQERANELPFSWDTGNESDGTYLIEVIAIDELRQVGKKNVTVTIQTIVPEILKKKPLSEILTQLLLVVFVFAFVFRLLYVKRHRLPKPLARRMDGVTPIYNRFRYHPKVVRVLDRAQGRFYATTEKMFRPRSKEVSSVEKIGVVFTVFISFFVVVFALSSFYYDYKNYNQINILLDMGFLAFGLVASMGSLKLLRRSIVQEMLLDTAMEKGLYSRMEPVLKDIAALKYEVADLHEKLDLTRLHEKPSKPVVVSSPVPAQPTATINMGTFMDMDMYLRIFMFINITALTLVYLIVLPGPFEPYIFGGLFFLWWLFITQKFKLWKSTGSLAWGLMPLILVPVLNVALEAFVGINQKIGVLSLMLMFYAFVYYYWSVIKYEGKGFIFKIQESINSFKELPSFPSKPKEDKPKKGLGGQGDSKINRFKGSVDSFRHGRIMSKIPILGKKREKFVPKEESTGRLKTIKDRLKFGRKKEEDLAGEVVIVKKEENPAEKEVERKEEEKKDQEGEGKEGETPTEKETDKKDAKIEIVQPEPKEKPSEPKRNGKKIDRNILMGKLNGTKEDEKSIESIIENSVLGGVKPQPAVKTDKVRSLKKERDTELLKIAPRQGYPENYQDIKLEKDQCKDICGKVKSDLSFFVGPKKAEGVINKEMSRIDAHKGDMTVKDVETIFELIRQGVLEEMVGESKSRKVMEKFGSYLDEYVLAGQAPMDKKLLSKVDETEELKKKPGPGVLEISKAPAVKDITNKLDKNIDREALFKTLNIEVTPPGTTREEYPEDYRDFKLSKNECKEICGRVKSDLSFIVGPTKAEGAINKEMAKIDAHKGEMTVKDVETIFELLRQGVLEEVVGENKSNKIKEKFTGYLDEYVSKGSISREARFPVEKEPAKEIPKKPSVPDIPPKAETNNKLDKGINRDALFKTLDIEVLPMASKEEVYIGDYKGIKLTKNECKAICSKVKSDLSFIVGPQKADAIIKKEMANIEAQEEKMTVGDVETIFELIRERFLENVMGANKARKTTDKFKGYLKEYKQ